MGAVAVQTRLKEPITILLEATPKRMLAVQGNLEPLTTTPLVPTELLRLAAVEAQKNQEQSTTILHVPIELLRLAVVAVQLE
jgi:hypothetical protein